MIRPPTTHDHASMQGKRLQKFTSTEVAMKPPSCPLAAVSLLLLTSHECRPVLSFQTSRAQCRAPTATASSRRNVVLPRQTLAAVPRTLANGAKPSPPDCLGPCD